MDLQPGEERVGSHLIRAHVATLGEGPRSSLDKPHIAAAGSQQLQPSKQKRDPIPQPEKQNGAWSSTNTLSDISAVLRSKNAGPYEITIDVIFESETTFRAVRDSPILSRERVSKALNIPEDEIIWLGFFEPALAFKVTIPRIRAGKKVAAGGFMENDIHGSQQHLGLATMRLMDIYL